MRIKKLALWSLALVVSTTAGADPGKEGAAFLDIPLGGAPSAMGSAYSALATDAYAPVINPAGLGFLRSTQLAAHHVSYFETSHYDFASLVLPYVLGGAIGASAQYFGTGDIHETDGSGVSLGDYSSHYGAYTLSYGRSWNDKLGLGLSGRWINAKIDDVSANAYAADAGAFWKASEKLHGALVVSNMGSKLKFIEESDSLPLLVKVGAAYLPSSRWKTSAEAVYRGSGMLSGRFGAEWRPMNVMALRSGYRTDISKELSALSGFSTGIGLFLWENEFAYTWMPYGDLGETHSFALLLKFGEKSNEGRALQRRASLEHEDLEYQYLTSLLAATETTQEVKQ